ncbi:MAG: DUF996 domain-containing protein [Thermoplasmata archaeon]
MSFPNPSSNHGPGTLPRARLLGIAGSILLLVGWTPAPGAIASIVGFLLILLAVRDVARATGDEAAYRNMLYFVILAIIGAVAITFVIFVAMSAMFGAFAPFFEMQQVPTFAEFANAFLVTFVGLVLVWAIYLVSAVFLWWSFKRMASTIGVDMFRTAALLFLIGAGLTIVLVGFIVIFVAEVLMIIAFASIPDPPPSLPQSG